MGPAGARFDRASLFLLCYTIIPRAVRRQNSPGDRRARRIDLLLQHGQGGAKLLGHVPEFLELGFMRTGRGFGHAESSANGSPL
jgi:hypothetical protein